MKIEIEIPEGALGRVKLLYPRLVAWTFTKHPIIDPWSWLKIAVSEDEELRKLYPPMSSHELGWELYKDCEILRTLKLLTMAKRNDKYRAVIPKEVRKKLASLVIAEAVRG